jgi:CheY-like chemotaxis protein
MKNAPEVLLVDDNPADIDLMNEVLAKSKQHFHVNAVGDTAPRQFPFCAARGNMRKPLLRTWWFST